MRICSECGTTTENDEVICPNCGAPLDDVENEEDSNLAYEDDTEDGEI